MIVPFHDIIISRGEEPGAPDVHFDEIEQGIRGAISTGFDSIQLRCERPRRCIDPLEREDLARILELAIDVGIQRVMFQTTLRVPVDQKDIEALCYCGVMFYRVPLFGHVAAVHDRCVGRPGALADIVRGLEAIGEVSITGVARPPFVILDCIIDPATREHLRDMVRFAADKGVDAVTLQLAGSELSYSSLVADIEASIDYCLDRDIWMEIGDVPQCLLGHRHVHCRDFYVRRTEAAVGTRLPGCSSCMHNATCGGISEQYLGAHGPAEFVPRLDR